MKREFLITGDGSTTIHIPDWNEQYHSKHGALAEAKHVFIEAGFRHVLQQNSIAELHLLEIGFGTGLNALLTYGECQKMQQNCRYTGVEAYPVLEAETSKLNYAELSSLPQAYFDALHLATWEDAVPLSPVFQVEKRKQLFSDISDLDRYHLIYFDAFGARVQPELWTEAIFKRMHNALKDKGVLVTYAAKGSVRRAMQAVGFFVERLPGPPGKREMLRATKTSSNRA